MSVDPVLLEVIRNGLTAAAEEMNATLIRTAFSPNIKERRDCSCALFDRSGEMITQAENIPVHLGAMPFSVIAALEAYPIDTLDAGDGILLNDPFRGGAHLPDLTLITPVVYDGDIVGFAANRAHHADVGGMSPGSIAVTTTEIYQEGLRIPPIRLLKNGEIIEEIHELLLENMRIPAERNGDLRAQLAANRTGSRRVEAVINHHGLETFQTACTEIKSYSERRMRKALADLPDGTYLYDDVLEGDGRSEDPLSIAVTLNVTGEEISANFSGSAPQTEGPINAVRAVTVSATYYAIRALTDPDIPPNAGCYRPISVVTSPGTIVHAQPPAAVVGGNLETSQRIVDVILGAFADSAPGRVTAAGQGTMNNVTFGGTDPRTGEEYAFYETIGGGSGGRKGRDGMDGVQVHMTNTMNTPVEVIETAYPLRIHTYALREQSGGAGEYRGGLGIRRDIEVRDHHATFSLLADRREHGPYGINGGQPGQPGEDVLIAEKSETLPSKTTMELSPGEIVSIRTPGGGGYGRPDRRDQTAIERDLGLAKVSMRGEQSADID